MKHTKIDKRILFSFLIIIGLVVGVTLHFSLNINIDGNSPLTTDSDSEIDPIKTGSSVNAYTLDHQLISVQENSSLKNNVISAQIRGVVLNPLNNSDPNWDYYVFDIYVSASPKNGWYVTSDDFDDEHGPSLNLTVNALSAASICLDKLCPSTLRTDSSDSQPQTTKIDMSVGVVSFGVSHTFTPPISKTQPTKITLNQVGWMSAGTTNGNPHLTAYIYEFAVGIKSPKGQPACIELLATGNFYRITGDYLGYKTYDGDSAAMSMSATFNPPPITTINSNPAGPGFVEVDGIPITTPAQFVWDEGNTHTITALNPIELENGLQYCFVNWSDGKSISHNIIAPTQETTILANFQIQNEPKPSDIPEIYVIIATLLVVIIVFFVVITVLILKKHR